MKKSRWIILMAIVLIPFLLFGFRWSDTKLTYLEYSTMNSQNDTWVQIAKNGDALTQEFVMPYNIIEGVSLQIGTFARDNNSTWKIQLVDDAKKLVCEENFNASQIVDNGYFRITFKQKQKVTQGKQYAIVISAEDVSDVSNIAFFVSQGSTTEGRMYSNDKEVDSDLCFRIYGGDKDLWWSGLIFVLAIYLGLFFFRCYFVSAQGMAVKDDILVQGMAVGVLAFALLASFSVAGGFCDESDNMYGGMIIAKGGVLYRDYVSQHTPVMYYLCAVFSLLGAGSIEQFRLSYYFFEALIWFGVYLRYSKQLGKKKIAFLPVLEIIGIVSVVPIYGTQILSDSFQGILLTILVLEYLMYIKDKQLKWDRCILLSACIWGGIGVAFMAVYAMVGIAIAVMIFEISDWRKKKCSIKLLFERYYKFIVSLIVPPTAAVIYFKANHSLKRAFDQFYTFNRVVYPKYTGEGESIVQPFVNSVKNFFNLFLDSFLSIITGTATKTVLLQFFVISIAVMLLIALCTKKRYQEGIVVGVVLIFASIRGYDFHGIAAWCIALLVIGLYMDLIESALHRIGKPVLGILAIILLSSYVTSVGDNVLYKQQPVSEMENSVIELMKNEDSTDIYQDVLTSDSLYYLYKDLKPVNCAMFMLPWYMDWYEKDNVESLVTKMPKVVIYNEDEEPWGYTHYSNEFVIALKENYKRVSEDGYGYNLWVRKE